MRLSLSEIRANAMKFSAEWAAVASERAEAQSFWSDLFAVFGIKRRSVASFEEKVKNLKGAFDRIDVFYAGVMIGEHKSLGQDLSKAASQAFDYVQSLQRQGRDSEIPQFIVVSDFQTIVVYDLESDDPAKAAATFKTAKLHENIKQLGFLSGYTTKPVDPEDPINIRAVEVLGALHDAMEKSGYSGTSSNASSSASCSVSSPTTPAYSPPKSSRPPSKALFLMAATWARSWPDSSRCSTKIGPSGKPRCPRSSANSRTSTARSFKKTWASPSSTAPPAMC